MTVDDGEGAARRATVFVDWSQNDRHKTTVRAYSLRAATPRRRCRRRSSWDEVEDARRRRRGERAELEPADVLERVEELGDLYADSLAEDQELPDLSA